MAFADSSETEFSFIEEVTWDVTPATPAFDRHRITGESMVADIQNVLSNEIRPDRMVSDLIQVGGGNSGGWEFELSFGPEIDKLLEHALTSTFAALDLKGGVEKKSLTVEKKFVGSADAFFRYSGCRINSLGLQCRAQEIIRVTMDVNGGSQATDTAIIVGATYNPANTNPVMASPTVASITVGGLVSSIEFTELSFTVNNNTRQQNAIGSVASKGIGYGRREIQGQMTAYFENLELYDLFVAGTPSTLSFTTSDGTNSYTWFLPQIKYTTGRVVAGGNNQDVFTECGFQALLEPTTENTDIKITKSS